MIDINTGQPPGDMVSAWDRAASALPGDNWWIWGVRCRRRLTGLQYEAWAGNGDETERGYSRSSPAEAIDDLARKLIKRRHA